MVSTLERWHDAADLWLVENPGDYPGAVRAADAAAQPCRRGAFMDEVLRGYYLPGAVVEYNPRDEKVHDAGWPT